MDDIDFKTKLIIALGTIAVVAAIVGITLVVFVTPDGVKVQNKYEEEMTKADLESDYKTSIDTESTLRSYKASYEADKITYETNKNSEIKVEQELASAAKTRANRTAVTYNNLLQHSLLDHIQFPDELNQELPYIE